MKKYLFLFLLAFAFNSCTVNDDDARHFVVLPVEDVTMPDSYAVDEPATIMIRYRRPTDCYIFNGFYVEPQGNTKIIAINAVIMSDQNCTDDSENLFEIPFEFTPGAPGEYVLKFYTGEENGEQQFITHEIIID